MIRMDFMRRAVGSTDLTAFFMGICFDVTKKKVMEVTLSWCLRCKKNEEFLKRRQLLQREGKEPSFLCENVNNV